ncbi:MAG: energy-coupling factor transporter transmembrane protein EcfT [Clostridia bacterium]|nr:energy-coupling factor transporter transmembrane protein EcfT [Clostridia bacterium]
MLKNITLGQFYPADSFTHKLDPRIKILLTIAVIILVFMSQTIVAYACVTAYLLLCAYMSSVPFKIILRGIKPLRFILLLTFCLNLFFSQGETTIFSIGPVTLTYEGLLSAVRLSLRLVYLIITTSLMTLTTSPISLSDGLESLFKPLKVIKFPAHELAMMMTITLRFIPTLLEEADKIMKAQMARGADFESGNLFKRAKSMIPLLVPLFVSAFRRAAELATAMEARCYHGGANRTKLRVLKLTSGDLYACLSYTALLAVFIIEGIVF